MLSRSRRQTLRWPRSPGSPLTERYLIRTPTRRGGRPGCSRRMRPGAAPCFCDARPRPQAPASGRQIHRLIVHGEARSLVAVSASPLSPAGRRPILQTRSSPGSQGRWHAGRCSHSTGRQGAAAAPSLSPCDKAVYAASDAAPRTPPTLRCDRRGSGKRAIDQLQADAAGSPVGSPGGGLLLRRISRSQFCLVRGYPPVFVGKGDVSD
jgi:hypothetical protein